MSKSVIIEGLIGSGKSTFSTELVETLGPNTLHLTEPDEKTNPYLSLYYEDPERWAFTIQAHLLQTRYRYHLYAQAHVGNGAGDAVMDRSYFGDVAFAQLQLDLKLMTPDEFTTYHELYKAMKAGVLYPHICIHLLVSPEEAIRRINRRMEEKTGRRSETAITLNYLNKLDLAYHSLMLELRKFGVEVIVVPWEEERRTKEERRPMLLTVAEKIRKHQVPDEFPAAHARLMR